MGRLAEDRSGGCGALERRHADILRDLVQLPQQRRGERDAVGGSVGAAIQALLTREPDGLDAREALRAAKVPDVAVDLGLEVRQWA